ncbi:MAG TPA: glycosyltransferase family 2 protein [Paludibacteraceae bacterium]|nr:glycosyltransferase family 2 protein [Paludibacteraceae bacterium]HQF50698.1 glycosyltransferase family 2 protein [Paludibacteraceae bacterium]HQJ89790.1 glycosyltransferase family 2 protein [Paludibacteraceae bacterium]
MISVCMSTYNGGRHLKEQVLSILSQLSDQDEVVVSDDGSTDDTIDVLSSFEDKRIRVFEHQKESSKYAFDYTTRNVEHALKMAKGDFIFLADQDDVWMPNKVTKFMEILKSSDLVLSDCVVTDSKLNQLSNSYFIKNGSKKGIVNNLLRNSYLGCCMAFRSSALSYVLPFPKTLVPHDIWIGLNVEMRGNVHFLDEPTLYYRRHESNLSTSSDKSSYSIAFRIYYRMMIIFNLLKRLYAEK